MFVLERAFWEGVWDWLLSSGLRILLIVAVAAAAIYLLRRLSHQLEKRIQAIDCQDIRTRERRQRAETIRHVIDGAVLVFALVVVSTMILAEIGMPVTPLLAGAGVIGITISLGAQSLIKDLLAGLFVLIEDQFSIGDSVTVAGVSGVVERITLRSTVLRDLEGTVHIVPNGEMRVVSNKTKDWARVVLRLGVAYDTDLDRAMEVLRQVGQEMARDPDWRGRLLEEPAVAGVDALRDSDIALLMTAKTPPGEQWAVAREARKRIVAAFGREGIEMPFPTQVRLTRVLGGAAGTAPGGPLEEG